MTLQFKTSCDGILLRRFDVSLWYHSWQVCNYFCVCKCLLFSFFCLEGCLLCMLQFHISHLNIKGSAYCLECKNGIVSSRIISLNYTGLISPILPKMSPSVNLDCCPHQVLSCPFPQPFEESPVDWLKMLSSSK